MRRVSFIQVRLCAQWVNILGPRLGARKSSGVEYTHNDLATRVCDRPLSSDMGTHVLRSTIDEPNQQPIKGQPWVL